MTRGLPGVGAVSVVTIGELTLGVLAATDDETRSRRLATLSLAESSYAPLVVDPDVARTWAGLTARGRTLGRRTPVNDCWIAATAIVHGLVIATQDRDYDGLGVEVLRL